MKIESVRGAVISVVLYEKWSRRVSLIKAMPTGTPGVFISTTPDNIEAMRQRVVEEIYDEDAQFDDVAKKILTAIGITEEAP